MTIHEKNIREDESLKTILVQRKNLIKFDIKFTFKNEAEQTFSMEVTSEEANNFKEACKEALGGNGDWFLVVDPNKFARFMLVKISELIHITTSL